MSTPHSLRVTRWAVTASFFVSGAAVASWVPHIPGMQRSLGLSHGVLGLVLLAPALGLLIAMVVAGGLSARIGNARLMRYATLLNCSMVPLTVLAPHPLLLVVVLTLMGLGNGAMGVAMNGEAVEVERAYGRGIMSSFHALYSLGCLVGAAIGGLVLTAGVPPALHLLAAALSIAALGFMASLRYLPEAEAAPGAQAAPPPLFVRPTRFLAILGTAAFCCMLVEGAMADWAALYMRDCLGASEGLAATGFAAFSLMMVTGRFTGDALTRAFGPVGIVRLGGALATSGVALALLGRHPVAALVGFGLVGLGLANVVPNFFSASGRERGMPAARAIAAVSSIGFAGFMAGPPLIGLIAQLTSLPIAMASLALFSGLVWTLAKAVAPPAAEPSPPLSPSLSQSGS